MLKLTYLTLKLPVGSQLFWLCVTCEVVSVFALKLKIILVHVLVKRRPIVFVFVLVSVMLQCICGTTRRTVADIGRDTTSNTTGAADSDTATLHQANLPSCNYLVNCIPQRNISALSLRPVAALSCPTGVLLDHNMNSLRANLQLNTPIKNVK